MALILAISSFEFGYALCEISTVPITKLMKYYHIHMDPGAANGLLVGIMPFGGIFGCILNRLFLYLLSRKYFITYAGTPTSESPPSTCSQPPSSRSTPSRPLS